MKCKFSGPNDLLEKRKQIDDIDRKILELISTRFKVVKEISRIKKRLHVDVLQPERIEEIINTRRELAIKYKINPDFIEWLYNEMIAESMRIEKDVDSA